MVDKQRWVSKPVSRGFVRGRAFVPLARGRPVRRQKFYQGRACRSGEIAAILESEGWLIHVLT